MRESVQILEKRLAEVIEPRGRLLTAYSGGVDSTVVAAAARRTLGRDAAPAAIGDSASLPRHELVEARQIAGQLDLELIEINPGEQNDPQYRANDGQRCYFCKSHLYESMHELADELGIRHIANGANVDDRGDHRPGMIAAEENRIVSPLLEAGFTKADVRALAHHWGLPNADKPAAACLASRIAYGTAVTGERLSMVERAEDLLREMGFTGMRVRHHEAGPAKIARIEVPVEQLEKLTASQVRDQVNAGLVKLGYAFVTVDLAGFRSGSGNVLLTMRVND
jgi:pyridinium-3,5-biscarboxylic acid mononucleotide sulfurtransferase